MEWLIGLVGVVIGVVLSWWTGRYETGRARKRAAEYLGRRIAFALDDLVFACAEVATGPAPHDYGDPRPVSLLPTCVALPEDGEWSALVPEDAESTMRIAARVRLTAKRVKDTAVVADVEDADAVARDEYTKIGLAADVLSAKFRERYKIGARESIGTWDPVEDLRRVRDRIDARSRESHPPL